MRRQWVPLRDWALWKRPRNWIAYTLAAEALTLALTVAAIIYFPVDGKHLAMFAVLAGLGILQAEISRKIERQRRSLNVTPHISMISVWLMASVLLLPPQLIALLSFTLYLHSGIRSWSGIQHVAMHRTLTNATTMALSCFAGVLLTDLMFGMDPLAGPDAATAVCVAGAAYFITNTAITAGGLYLAAPEKASVERLIGSWDDNLLDMATLCLGGLATLAMVHLPLLSVAIIVPIFVLQRSVLAKQLEELASKDQKTGLLNAVAWHDNGNHELSRASRGGREFSVLMIDLDFFKKINDTYGHLAGDDMLIALADLLKRETRTHDLVGRFGGEEFVVLLAGAPEVQALVAAERIRRMITELVVQSQTNDGKPVVITDRSASIGVATYPAAGSTLDEVLAAADAAVYVAKREGRNRVVGSIYPAAVPATPG
ncbi:diguanylate cyclase (GGDEF)-like protein [Kibdelosporangium banguiense]|uniref:Diguanylate cyclase (GGDEF)-like protein n=1 Tax=Kibdelosporangium banguiense TaxID=1365924 RepID=A0ABS4TD42_9PSEU|nr:GGDEF domain-containing protein [Kibdelosporangium banguiense]MBP2321980.1 diguanylate cyclase (GGDEF)-like protein [Kibdelosporangium banguiense]